MFSKYGQLIPDYVIDTFYTNIKDKMDNAEDYSHYIDSIKKLNNNKIPDIIQELINEKDI